MYDRSPPFRARVLSGDDVGNSFCTSTGWECNTAASLLPVVLAWWPSDEGPDAYRGFVPMKHCRGSTEVSVKITCNAEELGLFERRLCGHCGKNIGVEKEKG